VLEIVSVVEFPGSVVEAVDADVVEQAARAHKLGIRGEPVMFQ
jgi:hypothetical protein